MAYGNAIRSWAFRLTAKESLMIRSIISGLFLAATVTLVVDFVLVAGFLVFLAGRAIAFLVH